MVKFLSLSSGSNGNCYYIGNDQAAILIDAGIGPRTIKKRLSQYDISFDSINLILITHDHIDHIRGLGSLADRYCIPVYTTKFLYNSLLNFNYIGSKIRGFVKYTEIDTPSVFKGVSFTPFIVPHDATQTVGYHIDFYGTEFTFITDIGGITDSVINYCKKAKVLILEANYDLQMLWNGPYTEQLKKRISHGNGHLCNDQTAEIIREIYSEKLKYVFLCHLSEHNNTPEKAFETVSGAFENLGCKVGIDIVLSCLPRRETSELFLI